MSKRPLTLLRLAIPKPIRPKLSEPLRLPKITLETMRGREAARSGPFLNPERELGRVFACLPPDVPTVHNLIINQWSAITRIEVRNWAGQLLWPELMAEIVKGVYLTRLEHTRLMPRRISTFMPRPANPLPLIFYTEPHYGKPLSVTVGPGIIAFGLKAFEPPTRALTLCIIGVDLKEYHQRSQWH